VRALVSWMMSARHDHAGAVALADLRDDELRHHVAYVASEPGLTEVRS